MILTALLKRSVAKAITYRVIIMTLDFVTVFLLSGEFHVALTFMVVSNLYTTLVYLLHERLWARSAWGLAKIETSPFSSSDKKGDV
jgi:uncharacterized membrane protein